MTSLRRSAWSAVGLSLAASAVVGSGSFAWADTAPPAPAAPAAASQPQAQQGPLGANSPGDPTQTPEYLFRHFNTDHFGHRLVGFDAAVDNFPGWANYHLFPTGQEAISRGLAPSDPPQVKDDTWVPTAAPQYQQGSEHSTSDHNGPINVPVYPQAAPEYLGKWASGNPSPQEAVPALQEAARRATVPTNQSPPVEGDQHVDRRPGPQADEPIPVVPASANAQGQEAAKQVGAVGETVLTPVAGPSEGYGESGHGGSGQSGSGQGSGHDQSGHAESTAAGSNQKQDSEHSSESSGHDHSDARDSGASSGSSSSGSGSSHDSGSSSEGGSVSGSSSPLSGVLG